MTAIDLYRINDKIKRRYGKEDYYWRDDRSTFCFRQVWGFPDCNDVGIFNEIEEIRIDLKGQKMWHAEIEIARAPNGWYTFATNYQYSIGGGGYAPSVSADTAYTTREEAVDAALHELIDTYEKLRTQERPGSANQHDNAAKMIVLLRARLSFDDPEPTRRDRTAQAAQFSLF